MAEASGAQRPHTFVFADLAGYTAFTEARGDDAAAAIALGFIADARRLAAAHDAHFVKSMGDGVLLASHIPAAAICLGLHLAEELGARAGRTAIRVGMHTGRAVESDGDWFGAAVNIAARVGAAAEPGQVLLTDTTRDAAGPLDPIVIDDRGTADLRHVRTRLRLYSARRGGTPLERLRVDPVCHVLLGEDAAHHIEQDGTSYAFCSAGCRDSFDQRRTLGQRTNVSSATATNRKAR